jgi:hypothetical protein
MAFKKTGCDLTHRYIELYKCIHEEIHYELSRGSSQAVEALVCGPRFRNGRSGPPTRRRFLGEGRKETEEITAARDISIGEDTNVPNPAFLSGGSMAKTKSIISEVP